MECGEESGGNVIENLGHAVDVDFRLPPAGGLKPPGDAMLGDFNVFRYLSYVPAA